MHAAAARPADAQQSDAAGRLAERSAGPDAVAGWQEDAWQSLVTYSLFIPVGTADQPGMWAVFSSPSSISSLLNSLRGGDFIG